MHQFCIVDEKYESGRTYPALRNVIHFEFFAVVRRRLDSHDCIGDYVVQHARSHALGSLRIYLESERKYLVYSLTRKRGYVYGNEIVHKLQIALHFLVESIYGISIFFDSVPLVHNYYAGLALLVHVTANLYILFAHTLCGVNHYKHHVGATYCRKRTQYGILLYSLVDRTFFAYTGSIDDIEFI